MQNILFTLFLTIAISTVLNIVLKRFGISHIIGYIATGTIISYLFNFNGIDIHSLELIAEFGIVFLMFTIGLEMSFERIRKMKEILLLNGFLQVSLSSIIIFLFSHFIINIAIVPSIIISLAFSLSSTAIVLSYLKQSKDIYTPFGEKSTAILIFQDLAVIPILLLISFLANDTLSVSEVIINTFLSAVIVILFLFTIGKKLMNWLLKFASNTNVEELFLGSIFSIVMGASILAHEMGFTYSLGAFIAGMIIAETGFRIKIESDIATYKDFLLGTFFFSVGTKIDIFYFLHNIHYIFAIFVGIILIKAIVVYFIIRRKSNKSTAIKTAISLCQVGEFSFAIFALATNDGLLSKQLSSFLILITVLSMILTPFIISNVYKIASYFEVEFYESDKITPIEKKNHIIICGFTTLGRIIARKLKAENKPFVIISDDLRHVLLARKQGYMAYFGHLDKKPVLESLKVDSSSSIIITLSNTKRKRLICEAILAFYKDANIVLKINSTEERKNLKDLNIRSFVHAYNEVANLLIERAT
ncbi:potassium transporter [Malaciobacter molluscorum LMG 25693]|uniref:Glutathione-regulated potassium-efflux system protein, KefB/KefC family n=1 Tax=Malaciobacter molluscorum LMG 25693 TaxID=870501 RepID=A0A2G1DL46_9BACT|nr:cation:proton antiporter [Malaciobacter molluscorum]AXX92012.1 glutathione-regulated potassium-efflux system protein, KefB/KefC family [Malaciobacter molluscorum LMG 25693]PHO19245.1 potassium transporter [Malaciobacter molluscorum LMG 25693]RXJ96491.1 potassium transporter [Malaciobacter molluscorum]